MLTFSNAREVMSSGVLLELDADGIGCTCFFTFARLKKSQVRELNYIMKKKIVFYFI